MDWHRIISQWEKSGLSKADYCRKTGVPLHQLSYWKKRQSNPSGKFLQVIEPDSGEIELELKGVKIKVSQQSNLKLLKKILEALDA